MLNIEKGDGKVYTFIVKDEILPPGEGGREQSTVNWEYDFRVEGDGRDGDGGVGKGGEVGERLGPPGGGRGGGGGGGGEEGVDPLGGVEGDV